MRPLPAATPLDPAGLQAILRLSPVAIGVTRVRDGVIVEFNDAFLKLIGYGRDEVVGRTSAELGIWVDAAERAEVFRRLATGASVDEYVSTIRRKDGAIRRVRFSAAVADLGGEPFLVGHLRDVTEELASDAERQRAERRLRLSLAIMPVTVSHQDRALRYTAVANPQIGVAAEAIVGRLDADLFQSAEAAALTAIKARVLATCVGERHEIAIDLDGQTRWFDTIVEPERDADGASIGVICAAADVSERRWREERYRAVVEDQTEVICRFRPDGTMVFANAVYCRFFGRTPDEVLGQSWHRIAHAGDVAAVEAQLATLAPASPVVTVENRVWGADGREHWMQFVNRAFFDTAGRLQEIQSVGCDITERRAMEEALRHSEAHLRLAMGAAPLGTWEWDIASDRLTWSENLWRLFGLVPHSCPLNFSLFAAAVHPDDRSGVLAAVAAAVHQRGPYCITFRILRPDGTVRWALAHGDVLRDAAGEPHTMYGVDLDVTSLKQAEAELLASRTQLQELLLAADSQREEQRRDIAREIHDQLGATLTAAGFRIEGLRRQLAPDSPLVAELERIRILVTEAGAVARDLCTRLRPPVLDDLGLVATCRWYLEDWSATAGIAARGRFARLAQEPPDPLRTDFFRILQELLTNVARHAAAGRVHVSLRAARGRLVLTVRDNGRGFGATREGGLGLVGIRERARRHGGEVTIESAGVGAMVRVTVPWAPPAPCGPNGESVP